MIFSSWLRHAEHQLSQAGIGTARLDAQILAEHVTGIDRALLMAEPNRQIPAAEITKLNNLLRRRVTHEPLAYILGQVEFYGRSFVVNEHVLVPRPESETMIDELKNLPNLGTQPSIIDVGTGTGALGITAKLELPEAKVILVDIEELALKVAKTNVDKFTLSIDALESDLLAHVTVDSDVLLCNLPYVPDDFEINTAASKEPRLAIYGGKDGLDLYRGLLGQLSVRQNRPLYLLFESLSMQHTALQTFALDAGYETIRENDFIQVLKRIQK